MKIVSALIAGFLCIVAGFEQGEGFSYEVRYKGVKVGKSVLTFQGEDSINGKDVYHITFSTRVNAFTDVEELYADKETFLPVEVRRTLKRFGTFTTKIVERYDQKRFAVEIKQKTRFHKKEFSIKKKSPIHNAILVTYFCRTLEAFDKMKDFRVNLPTAEFEVSFHGQELIETPLGKFQTYVFTSRPERFKFWLSADEKRIPLKIENPSGLDYSFNIVSIDTR